MEKTEKKRVVVAMSGGVDSSVAAALYKEQGHEVIGMTMQIWDYSKFDAPDGETFGTCCSLDDVYDARRVAESLDIPFYVVNFEAHFQEMVIDPFCDDYFNGRTPNPCILCNQVLKFEILLRRARELQADWLATGHYAQIIENGGFYQLHKGIDEQKDQSYFLFTLNQEQMRMIRFPLGGLTKEEVREHAVRLGLRVAEKPESQDICFVPDGDYVRFLEEERGGGSLNGDIVHVSGRIVGQHQGIYRYTIGQRKGLGISWPEPLFVVGIDVDGKQVIVGEKKHLARSDFTVYATNWSRGKPDGDMNSHCRIRYRHREVPARVEPLPGNRAHVSLEQPQDGVTPGQAAVFYSGDEVVGGGWIE